VIKNILLVVKSLAAVSPSHSREQPVEKKNAAKSPQNTPPTENNKQQPHNFCFEAP
jgi:hypothetical protein